MAENQSSLQELQRRSQLLTCDSVETVLVDRKTLEEITWGLAESLDGLREVGMLEEFLVAVRGYLRNPEQEDTHTEKALLFLDAWFDKSPDTLGINAGKLDEAHKVLRLILCTSKMGDA